MKALQRKFVAAVVMLVAAANLAVAADIPMWIDWRNIYGPPAVYADGKPTIDNRNASYINGIDGIQCYLGVGGKNVVLFTYNTVRTLYFDKSVTQEPSIWEAAGILQPAFNSVVVSYVQTKSRYQSMKIGDIVTAKGAVQFQYGGNTYNLRYPALAVKKIGPNSWLLTSDYRDTNFIQGVVLHKAMLSILRNGGHVNFGYVAMPIRFDATILP